VLEQFKDIVPDRIATYINEHKVKTAADAAVLADEFVLTHKSQFSDYHSRSVSSRKHDQNTGNMFLSFQVEVMGLRLLFQSQSMAVKAKWILIQCAIAVLVWAIGKMSALC